MGKVLVIRGGALGDFVLTLPAIRLLREGLPKAEVEVLGYRPMVDLAVEAGVADGTRSIEHAAMASFFAPGADLDAELAAWFAGFSVVISYLYDPEGIFRDNMERAGVETFYQGTWQVSHHVEDGQAAHQLARVCQRLALWLEDPAPVVRPARPMTERTGLAVHPGSGSTRKNWPLERWMELGPELVRRLPDGEPLTVLSGEAEEAWIGDLLEAWGKLPVRHLRHAPLGELADTLADARAFLGHDSGVSHLAAACGIPCRLLFGPTDPDVWAPANPGVEVLRAPGGEMEKLQAHEILSAVEEALASG